MSPSSVSRHPERRKVRLATRREAQRMLVCQRDMLAGLEEPTAVELTQWFALSNHLSWRRRHDRPLWRRVLIFAGSVGVVWAWMFLVGGAR